MIFVVFPHSKQETISVVMSLSTEQYMVSLMLSIPGITPKSRFHAINDVQIFWVFYFDCTVKVCMPTYLDMV